MSKSMSKTKFSAHMKKLTDLPQGFTHKMESESWGWGKYTQQVYVVRNEDDSIEIRFDQNGSGHTRFTVDGVKVSFDRLGVEDSFYHYDIWNSCEPRNLNEILKEQLERIAEYREYKKTALSIPGTPFTVAPDRLGAMKAKLKKGEFVYLTPSGFGTGYTIGRKRHVGSKPASHEMEKFFDVGSLYISSHECD